MTIGNAGFAKVITKIRKFKKMLRNGCNVHTVYNHIMSIAN